MAFLWLRLRPGQERANVAIPASSVQNGGVQRVTRCSEATQAIEGGGVMAKILVVDDEKSIRTLCQEELEDEGYEVITTGTCTEVLDLIASAQPSAVVLDIRMEDCDGLDLLQEIRNAHQALPIILNTAYDSYRDDVKTVAADHYVVKSFDLAELKLKLTEVFEE